MNENDVDQSQWPHPAYNHGDPQSYTEGRYVQPYTIDSRGTQQRLQAAAEMQVPRGYNAYNAFVPEYAGNQMDFNSQYPYAPAHYNPQYGHNFSPTLPMAGSFYNGATQGPWNGYHDPHGMINPTVAVNQSQFPATTSQKNKEKKICGIC